MRIIYFLLPFLISFHAQASWHIESRLDFSSFFEKHEIRAAAVPSPDGKLIALFSAVLGVEGRNNRAAVYPRIQIIDITSGLKRQELKLPAQYDIVATVDGIKRLPARLSWSADSKYIISNNFHLGYISKCHESSYAYLIDLKKSEVISIRENNSTVGGAEEGKCVRSVASFQPGGQLVLLSNDYMEAQDLPEAPADEVLLLDTSLKVIRDLKPQVQTSISDSAWTANGQNIILEGLGEYSSLDLEGRLTSISKTMASLSIKTWHQPPKALAGPGSYNFFFSGNGNNSEGSVCKGVWPGKCQSIALSSGERLPLLWAYGFTPDGLFMYKDVWDHREGTTFFDPISNEIAFRSRETSKGGQLSRISSDTMILANVYDGLEIWKQ